MAKRKSKYPNALDNKANWSPSEGLEIDRQPSDYFTSEAWDLIEDAILEIEKELGTDPAGPDATVSARLTHLRAHITSAQADIDGFPDELENLITHEIQQLETLGGVTTISVAQWGYLGAMGAQPLENIVEDITPQLGGNLDAQNNSINNVSAIDGLSAAEIAEYANLGATTLSAAQLGALGALVEWTDWVPTLDGGADLSGYTYARYYRIGNICFFYFTAEDKNVTTPGGIQITLPFTVANTGYQVVSSMVYDGTSYVAGVFMAVYPNTNYLAVYKTKDVGAWAGDETDVILRLSGFFEII